jgi:hypothetical protein
MMSEDVIKQMRHEAYSSEKTHAVNACFSFLRGDSEDFNKYMLRFAVEHTIVETCDGVLR